MANKHYRLTLGQDFRGRCLPLHGLGSQIRAAAALMQVAALRGDRVHPTIPALDGRDLWQEIFDSPPPPPGAIECPCDELEWNPAMEQAHHPAASDHIQFRADFRERLDYVWKMEGECRVGLSLRETDKLDGGECPLPPSIIAETLCDVHEPFLVFSDTTIYLTALFTHFPDSQVFLHTRGHRSHSIFPLHVPRGASPLMTGESLAEHTIEIFEDMYLMSKLERIYYPVWHGVLSIAKLLNPAIDLVCCRRSLNLRDAELIRFYMDRELALWKRLDHQHGG